MEASVYFAGSVISPYKNGSPMDVFDPSDFIIFSKDDHAQLSRPCSRMQIWLFRQGQFSRRLPRQGRRKGMSSSSISSRSMTADSLIMYRQAMQGLRGGMKKGLRHPHRSRNSSLRTQTICQTGAVQVRKPRHNGRTSLHNEQRKPAMEEGNCQFSLSEPGRRRAFSSA